MALDESLRGKLSELVARNEYLTSLDRNATPAFHCHHGVGSVAAARRAGQEGFRNLYDVEGGIDAWSQTVDPCVRRY